VTIAVTVLGSGSRGNAILVDGSRGTVLVDVGFGVRTISRRLAECGRHPGEVEAVLLTHDHQDHACGAGAAARRWGWPVAATSPTLAALTTAREAPATVRVLDDSPAVLGGFAISHAPVPHDAADCRAFVLTDEGTGARIGIVLDCGHVPPSLPSFLSGLDLLVVESNHDAALLANGPYPWPLKQRIRDGQGHLSNMQTGTLLESCAHRGLRGVLLAHLSETNNTPELAMSAARVALRRGGWLRDALVACPQRVPTIPLHATGRFAPVRSRQLPLEL
jgi:phosphoribosyl 1,2-cyclic phosphodiesterase